MNLRHKSLSILLVAVLVFCIAIVGCANYKKVTIEDENRRIKFSGFTNTVQSTLEKVDINLNAYDKVSVDLNEKVTNNMKIIIKRAKPINITIDGKEQIILSTENKVEDILREQKIHIGPEDEVYPTTNEILGEDKRITIAKVIEKSLVQTEEIPYNSIIKHSNSLKKGTIKLLAKGKSGEKSVEYKVLYKNGEEISREVLNEEILVKPVDEVVEKGTIQYVATSRGQMRVKKAIKMRATAYDLSYESCGKRPGDKYYGITYSGTKAKPGVVAVDPRVVPLGSKLYVKALDGTKDYGFASAEDTGGAIKGNRIDLFISDSKKVYEYGIRNVMVYVLE